MIILKEKIDGKTYGFYFRYKTIKEHRSGYLVTEVVDKTETSCHILNLENGKYNRISVGVSFTHPDDQHVKEIGRKVSFRRAVNGFSEDKEIRKLFWNTYLNRK